MKRFKIAVIFLFAAFFIFLTGYYLFLIFGVKPENLRRAMLENIEEVSGGTLKEGDFHLSYFPTLRPEIRNATLLLNRSGLVSLKAQKLQFRFRLFSFLLNEKDINGIVLENGEAIFRFAGNPLSRDLQIGRMSMKVLKRDSGKKIHVAFEGDFQGMPKSISGTLIVGNNSLKKWKWESLVFDGELQLHDLDLGELFENSSRPASLRVKTGKLNGKIWLDKNEGENAANARGQASLQGFRYELKEGNPAVAVDSVPMNTDLVFETDWSPSSEEWHLKKAVFHCPVGKFEFSGTFLSSGEFKNVRLNASDISLEAIPQYYLPFKEAIPFNIGFSGKSSLETSIEGTAGHFMLHANADLTASLLTYSGYFTKPKDLPLHLTLDFLVKNNAQISGDFSLRLQDAAIKGTLSQFDLKTKKGQLNAITNKFQLKGWETLLPVFQNYTMEGEIKLLSNLEGDLSLQHPQELKSMLNITVENGSLVRKDGLGIGNVQLSLDYGLIALDVKQAKFSMGPSSVSLSGRVYNPLENPNVQMKIVSPKLDAALLLETVESLGEGWLSEKVKANLKNVRQSVLYFLPRSEFLEDFSSDLEMKDKQWLFHLLQFKAYDGSGKFKGELHWDGILPAYTLEAEIAQLKLARFFSRGGNPEKEIDGNLFLTARLQGRIPEDKDWKQAITGDGDFSITNGEFHTFDILGEIAKINGFAPVKSAASGKTSFHDLRSHFLIKDGKVMTEKMMLLAGDFSAFADGEASLDGVLNFRTDIFIAMPLAAAVLEPFVGKIEARQNQQLGPVPFLLSGRLETPELNPNPALLPRLQDNLTRKKTQKVLRSFLPEDFLFERPTSS